jgi:hypothetical protein
VRKGDIIKRLYNEYGACPYWRDPVLEAFDELVNDCSKKIVEYVKVNELDVRDAISYTNDCLDVFFSEMMVRRAIDMRRKEREEKALKKVNKPKEKS